MGTLFDKVKQSGGDLRVFQRTATQLTMEARQLHNAMLQLTPVCNLHCKMCYARMDHSEVEACGRSILSFADWQFYIDGIAQAGALNLTLTGGECTLHPEFAQIYAYAYDKGLQVNVMTNCTYLPSSLLALWMEKPPTVISATVYGFTAETYGRLCGNAALRDVVYQNIDRLLQANLYIAPKYTLVQDNLDDWDAVDAYFFEKKMSLPVSVQLMAFDHCDAETAKAQTVDPEEYQQISQRIWMRRRGTPNAQTPTAEQVFDATYYRNVLQNQPPMPRGIFCTASRNLCYINWMGQMTPCVSLNAFAEDPRESSFAQCWTNMGEWAKTIEHPQECVRCPFRTQCNYCVALHYNETGSFGKLAERICWKRNNPEEVKRLQSMLPTQAQE